jgi:hypothetical protein
LKQITFGYVSWSKKTNKEFCNNKNKTSQLTINEPALDIQRQITNVPVQLAHPLMPGISAQMSLTYALAWLYPGTFNVSISHSLTTLPGLHIDFQFAQPPMLDMPSAQINFRMENASQYLAGFNPGSDLQFVQSPHPGIFAILVHRCVRSSVTILAGST